MMAAKFPALLPGAIVYQRRAVRLGIGERIGCFSVHRALETSDVGSHALDAASIAVSRRSRRVKTDWIDVETLLRTLSGGVRGKRRICSWCGHRGKHFTLSVAETLKR
jgi:hypothetical protein